MKREAAVVPGCSALLMRGERQDHLNEATSRAVAVGDFNSAAMGFGNLAREDKTDAAPARLCRIKRSEHVGWIEKAGAIVFDKQIHL